MTEERLQTFWLRERRKFRNELSVVESSGWDILSKFYYTVTKKGVRVVGNGKGGIVVNNGRW